MSSSPKRRRTSDNDDNDNNNNDNDNENAGIDPDQTPKRTRPQGHPDGDVFTDTAGRAPSATSASSFAAVLTSRRPAFSSATQQHAATRATSRSSSPSKPAVRVPNLLDLAIPVRFDTPRVLGDALPSDDVFRLFEALSVVAGTEGILPAALRHHADFAEPRIRPFMWAPPASVGATPDEDERILRNHEKLQELVDESTRSLALSRSEAAWNCLVHAPFLKFALCHADSFTFEPITAAQILPAFRPVYKSSGGPAFSASSASASSGNDSVQSLNRPSAPAASSVHKMVDFALVLEPEEKLQILIDAFLDGETPATASINQTRYEPLRKRPAPIFIETKTGSGTVDGARVQMGIWVAAWHQRMRGIISRGGGGKPVMTVPVIQVMGGQWTLFFVVDGGTEIRILDSGLHVGRTDTILGVYQLQATMSVLASWAKGVFEPWLVEILTEAQARRANVYDGPRPTQYYNTPAPDKARELASLTRDDRSSNKRPSDGRHLGQAHPWYLNSPTSSNTNHDHGQVTDKYGANGVSRHLDSDTNIARAGSTRQSQAAS